LKTTFTPYNEHMAISPPLQ